MSRFLIRIFIVDILILSIQAALLVYHPFRFQKNYVTSDLIIHLIFTIKNNTILFLNPPLFIFLYYVLFLKKINGLMLKLLLLGILNFIILYCISWIEMLLLIANDVKV